MNERQHFFARLVESLRGHFHTNAQKKVNKLTLLELLFSRMDCEESGLTSLVDAYIQVNKIKVSQSKKRDFYQSVRHAVRHMQKWIKEYYSRHPEVPIRFTINKDYVLETTVRDGYDQFDLKSLNEKISKLLREQAECINLISKIRSGKAKVKHADRIQTALDRNEEIAKELNKLSAAARRRT